MAAWAECNDLHMLTNATPPFVAAVVRVSVLNDCLQSIVNAERKGKRQVLVRPSSKVVVKFLSVMQKHGESHNAERETIRAYN